MNSPSLSPVPLLWTPLLPNFAAGILITTWVRTKMTSVRRHKSSQIHSSGHVEFLSVEPLTRRAGYRLSLGRVGHSSRLQSTTRKTLWKTRLSPDSTPAMLSQHRSAAARLDRRVTRAQPSARVQRLIYCLIAWPQFGVKMAVKVALWRWRKGGESEYTPLG